MKWGIIRKVRVAIPKIRQWFRRSGQALELVPYLLGIGVWRVRRALSLEPGAGPDSPFCSKPFEWFEAKDDGRAFLCCSGWLPTSAGNLNEDAPEKVWNSKVARRIRESILDGSFVYCKKKRCPSLVSKQLPLRREVRDSQWVEVIRAKRVTLPTGPRVVNASYDRTCNLSCPSCRTEPISMGQAQRTQVETIQQKLFAWKNPELRTLYVTGSGDPFASPLFRKLLAELDTGLFSRLKLRLHTNGLLLTPALWLTLSRIHERVEEVEISIDASTAETYRKLRRGGDFTTLLARLEFLRRLRETGKIPRLLFSFVVQEENFREMADFVALSKRFGADRVHFNGLADWGTYGRSGYRRRAIHRTWHPRYREFQKYLEDPQLEGDGIFLGNLKAGHRFLNPI